MLIVKNQSPFNLKTSFTTVLQCVNQNNGVNDTSQIHKRALCTSMTCVLIAIRGLLL